MAVTLPTSVLEQYTRFTLHNSPYAAHDRGHAVDRYPGETTHPDPEDGDPVTGIALAPARDRLGVKLVGEHDLAVETDVTVTVEVAA